MSSSIRRPLASHLDRLDSTSPHTHLDVHRNLAPLEGPLGPRAHVDDEGGGSAGGEVACFDLGWVGSFGSGIARVSRHCRRESRVHAPVTDVMDTAVAAADEGSLQGVYAMGLNSRFRSAAATPTAAIPHESSRSAARARRCCCDIPAREGERGLRRRTSNAKKKEPPPSAGLRPARLSRLDCGCSFCEDMCASVLVSGPWGGRWFDTRERSLVEAAKTKRKNGPANASGFDIGTWEWVFRVPGGGRFIGSSKHFGRYIGRHWGRRAKHDVRCSQSISADTGRPRP